MNPRDKHNGSLLGLAVGDAVGTALEFQSPGSFTPISDMVGGGAFSLAPGQWTDDTAMALCLAESLVECNGFDPADQMRRYVRWWREGHHSSTERCFDIGNTTRGSLEQFLESGDPYAGPTDPLTAGNGSLMRLAPVPLYYVNRPVEAIERAADSSRTTHAAPNAIDACRLMAWMIICAVQGMEKSAILSPENEPAPGYWRAEPLAPEVEAIRLGSFRDREPPEIAGTGYVVKSLEAALWAFHKSGSFREGCLLAANLGNDADTTAAIFGQLAGAHYGEQGMPEAWRAKVLGCGFPMELVRRLYELRAS
ncbi:MAG: ADP-ribosylglycohydrolase family protein [Phycisphaerales bacterium]|nr:ADP-ribosylglycohydrolase family protein [Phycisphaerales bacterium]MCB9856875.1 ADP-ribosylglycohydrolase family protein [Phycisphaerales bacterium]MCB9861998.1 ADP-ribosylglycohydrolase family protein [Phycisphaerales bacterium]